MIGAKPIWVYLCASVVRQAMLDGAVGEGRALMGLVGRGVNVGLFAQRSKPMASFFTRWVRRHAVPGGAWQMVCDWH